MSRLLCDCVHDDYFVASFAAAHVGSGVPNLAKDGIAPLEGVVETDWLSFTFTMNWIFTRPGRVRFEADEPFCFITPVNYRAIEAFEPTIEACTAKFQGDDCVNIHGTYHLVTAVDGPRLRIAVLGRPTIEPGDPVEFLPFTGPRPPDAVAASIVADPTPITDAEKDRIRPVSLNDKNKTRLLDGDAKFFTLTLDREVSLPPLSAVCSGNRVGNGFVIRDCDFGFNRSRGILIKASRGQVVGNTISHGWMAAVLVAPEYWWFESASASDVEIRDNTIVGCRRTAIEVVAQGGDGKPLPAGAHRGITITGNRIADSAWPNIFVTSTTDLVLADNELTPTETSPFTPPLQRPWPWNGRTPAPIVTEETVPGTESGPHER